MATRDLLLQSYWRLERAIAPDIRYSQLAYEDVLRRHAKEATVWLDLGCGRRILPQWRRESEAAIAESGCRVVGVDVDERALKDNASIALKCGASGATLPFAEDTFDLVTANMVVEHLEDPERQFREISRVMRPDGLFIIHTPNATGYPTLMARLVPRGMKSWMARYLEGRDDRDVFQTFYRANSERTIDSLARASSLRVLDLEFIRSTPVFGLVPPVAALELLWSRALKSERLKRLRTSIIAVLQKLDPATASIA